MRFPHLVFMTAFSAALAPAPYCHAEEKIGDHQLAGAREGLDAAEILKHSDTARGGGLPGITWNIKVLVQENGAVTDQQALTVKADPDNSLIEFTDPPKVKGQKLLMVNENMWFLKPGLRRAVPISARQKLAGQAANGDVAATDYARDYQAKILGEEPVDGETCHKLELTAAKEGVTYDKIVYWISKSGGTGTKAEFYTVSGKLFKSARFEYKNIVAHEGRRIPFISKMTIQDEIEKSAVTTLEYSGIKPVTLPPQTFNINFLNEN